MTEFGSAIRSSDKAKCVLTFDEAYTPFPFMDEALSNGLAAVAHLDRLYRELAEAIGVPAARSGSTNHEYVMHLARQVARRATI